MELEFLTARFVLRGDDAGAGIDRRDSAAGGASLRPPSDPRKRDAQDRCDCKWMFHCRVSRL
jgi:hypothetical protein